MLALITEAAFIGLEALLLLLQSEIGLICLWDEICTLLLLWRRTGDTLSAAGIIDIDPGPASTPSEPECEYMLSMGYTGSMVTMLTRENPSGYRAIMPKLIQEQKPYFKLDLLETTRFCNALLVKIAENLTDLPESSSSGGRDLNSIFITQHVLQAHE
jgi:hypothetical protein